MSKLKYISGTEGGVKWCFDSVNQKIAIEEIFPDTKEIVFPSHIEGIPVKEIDSPFSGTKTDSVEKVVVPSNIQRINVGSFADFTGLKDVEFEEESSLEMLESYTFFNCSSLESLTIPDSVLIMEKHAVSDCLNLKELYVGANVTPPRGVGLVTRCGNLEKVVINPENTHMKVIDGCIVDTDLKKVILGCRTTEKIPDNPEEVNSIGSFAFGDVTLDKPLKVIPPNIKNIGMNAFTRTRGLGELKFSEGLKKIQKNAFDGSDVGDIETPASLETLEYASFKSCKNIGNVSLGKSTKLGHISSRVFENCEELKNVVLPEGITTMYEAAFMGCISLESVFFPSTLDHINSNSFFCCVQLEEVDLSDTRVNYIGQGAFESCFGLRDLFLPETLNVIADCAFRHCKSLEIVGLPDGLSVLGRFAFCDTGLNMIAAVPPGVEGINEGTFRECPNLRGVVLPPNGNISESAFEGCRVPFSVFVPKERDILDISFTQKIIGDYSGESAPLNIYFNNDVCFLRFKPRGFEIQPGVDLTFRTNGGDLFMEPITFSGKGNYWPASEKTGHKIDGMYTLRDDSKLIVPSVDDAIKEASEKAAADKTGKKDKTPEEALTP